MKPVKPAPTFTPLDQDPFVIEIMSALQESDRSIEKTGKRGRPFSRSDEEVATALLACGGFMSKAAEKLNMHYTSLSVRVNKSDKLKGLVTHIKETMLDYAELELMKAMKRGESWAICFFLKCKGKERGYVEKQVVVNSGNDNAVQIIIE